MPSSTPSPNSSSASPKSPSDSHRGSLRRNRDRRAANDLADHARAPAPQPRPPCDSCPQRPDCTAICDALEAELPQMYQGSLALFTEHIGLPIAEIVARRKRVQILLDYRHVLAGMGLAETIFNEYYNSAGTIEVIADRHGIHRNAAVWHLTHAHRRIMGHRRLRLMQAIHPRTERTIAER